MSDGFGLFLGFVMVIGGALWCVLPFVLPFLILGWIGKCLRNNQRVTPVQAVESQPPKVDEARRARKMELEESRKRVLAEQAWMEGAN